MKKLIPIAVALLLAVLVIPAAYAASPKGQSLSTSVSEPSVIVGTYSWHDSATGARVTVGYSPCGHQWTEGSTTYFDPDGKYYGKAQKGGGWTYEAWAHDPTDLNGAMQIIGITLTEKAYAQLNEDAVTYTCTA